MGKSPETFPINIENLTEGIEFVRRVETYEVEYFS